VRRALISAAALVAFGLATAATAQSGPSAEDDLDCALLSAVEAGKAEDAETRNGLIFMMLYFAGRWEGTTGRKFEVVMTPRGLNDAALRSEELAGKCVGRMESFGNRLEKLATLLKKAGR